MAGADGCGLRWLVQSARLCLALAPLAQWQVSANVLRIGMEAQYLSAEWYGEPSTLNVECQVMERDTAFFIRVLDPSGTSPYGLESLASSPFASNEWLLLLHGPERMGTNRTVRFDYLAVDSRLTAKTLDAQFAHLARIIYLDPRACTSPLRDAAIALFDYLKLSQHYLLEDLELREVRTPGSLEGHRDAIRVFIPNYVRDPSGKRKALDGRLSRRGHRLLFELEFGEMTNTPLGLLPASFTTVGYGHPLVRQEAAGPLPTGRIRGILLATEEGFSWSLSDYLEQDLQVFDWRPAEQLFGYPASYVVTNGKWPVVGSAEYEEMVVSNRSRLEGEIDIHTTPIESNRLPFLILLAVLLVPPLLLGRRLLTAKQHTQ
jgi:hypothetical protein